MHCPVTCRQHLRILPHCRKTSLREAAQSPGLNSDSMDSLIGLTEAKVEACMMHTLCARWVETRDEEQAVSVEMQGPVRPKVYDRRPTMKLRPEPTAAWGGSFLAAATMTSVYSWYMQPT